MPIIMWWRLWQWNAHRPRLLASNAVHHRYDQHGVTDSALDRPAVDRDHLKRMAVQIDRMRAIIDGRTSSIFFVWKIGALRA